MTTDLPLCSTAARERGEPMAGSAPTARRWLLVEHPGPWGRDPLMTPPLVGDVGRALAEACDAVAGRVLLIRRDRARFVSRSWYAVDPVARRQVSGEWRTGEDLYAAADALRTGLDTATERAESLVLVCTHGVRDTCCAVRGRPIAAALEDAEPGRVWECSHLGGHRFAGTLLVLPEAACYGGLDADTAVECVAAHRVGAVDGAQLRGLTTHSPAEQAAVAWVLRTAGPAAVDAVGVSTASSSGDVTRVTVAGGGDLPAITHLTVTRRALPPAPLSCGARPGEHAAYDVAPA